MKPAGGNPVPNRVAGPIGRSGGLRCVPGLHLLGRGFGFKFAGAFLCNGDHFQIGQGFGKGPVALGLRPELGGAIEINIGICHWPHPRFAS